MNLNIFFSILFFVFYLTPMFVYNLEYNFGGELYKVIIMGVGWATLMILFTNSLKDLFKFLFKRWLIEVSEKTVVFDKKQTKIVRKFKRTYLGFKVGRLSRYLNDSQRYVFVPYRRTIHNAVYRMYHWCFVADISFLGKISSVKKLVDTGVQLTTCLDVEGGKLMETEWIKFLETSEENGVKEPRTLNSTKQKKKTIRQLTNNFEKFLKQKYQAWNPQVYVDIYFEE